MIVRRITASKGIFRGVGTTLLPHAAGYYDPAQETPGQLTAFLNCACYKLMSNFYLSIRMQQFLEYCFKIRNDYYMHIRITNYFSVLRRPVWCRTISFTKFFGFYDDEHDRHHVCSRLLKYRVNLSRWKHFNHNGTRFNHVGVAVAIICIFCAWLEIWPIYPLFCIIFFKSIIEQFTGKC